MAAAVAAVDMDIPDLPTMLGQACTGGTCRPCIFTQAVVAACFELSVTFC